MKPVCEIRIAVILCLSWLITESYRLFSIPEIRLRNWFLLNDTYQDIDWYFKETSTSFQIILIAYAFYIVSKRVSLVLAKFANAYLIGAFMDLVMYWVNRRAVGNLYCYMVYGSILIYIIITFSKRLDYMQTEFKNRLV